MNELLVLFCAGVLMALWRGGTRVASAGQMMLGLPLALQWLAAGAAGAVPFSLSGLFLYFVKVGA